MTGGGDDGGWTREESAPRPSSVFRHERLEVWHLSVDYATLIYRITTYFPDDERYALTNQIRRASVSVSSNIAEGNGRYSTRDKLRFIEIACGSLLETLSQATIAVRLGYISNEQNDEIHVAATPIVRLLSGFRSSLERTLGSPKPRIVA